MPRLIALIFVLLSLSTLSHAMQPVQFKGESIGPLHFNTNIDVVAESFTLDVSNSYDTADYQVEYTIINNQSGNQIPFAFSNNSGRLTDISIRIDGVPVTTQFIENTADTYEYNNDNQKWRQALSKYDQNTFYTNNGLIDFSTLFQNNALVHYIATDLAVGKHVISVASTTTPDYYGSDLTGKHSFRISFAAVKPWQGFKGSSVQITYNGPIDHASVNIENNESLPLKDNLQWHFKQPPYNMDITFQKPFSPIIQLLSALSIWTILFALIFLSIKNYQWLKKTQLHYPNRTWGYMVLGGFVVPLLSLAFYYVYILIIDLIIGQGATREARSLFFIWVLPAGYIVITPLYFILILIACIGIRRRYPKKKQDNDSVLSNQ